jgi:membrane protease subunit HflC
MRKTALLIPAFVVIIVLAVSSIFIVDEREKALVLQFGQIVTVKEEPGIGFKIPLIQEVVTYDDRILSRDLDPIEVTPADDRRLVVDAFARFRIADVEQFRRAVGAGGLAAASQRLDSILRAETREVLGSVTSNDILSTDRAALMLRIRNGAIVQAQALGLQVLDVRLKRTDLPEANLNATYERMKAEREREAADEVARGREAAQRIQAQADRTVIELVSEAEREAQVIQGEADALRNEIFATAFGEDPEFFEFYRSMTAYQRALQGGNTMMVMSPESEFFNYLRSAEGADSQQAPDDGDTGAAVQSLAPVEDEAALR